MEKLLEMQKINKSYKMGTEALHVLKDIELTVFRGEYLTILGPSGSGKSTLMNLIGLIDNADNGTYILDGTGINGLDDEQLTKIRNLKIGFIFQKYHLIPQYTALQNVIMPLLLRGYTRNKAIEAAKESIELVGLADRMAHKPSELSGGQQQRVAIARALVTKPALLLADEPTGALDSKTGEDILGLIKKLNESGKTVVMISHDRHVASESHRIIELYDGRIC